MNGVRRDSRRTSASPQGFKWLGATVTSTVPAVLDYIERDTMRIATTTLPTVVAGALITLTVHQGVADESGDKAVKPDHAAMRAKMLKRIDTNGDGKLSREELAKARSESAKRPGGAGKLENHRLEVVTFPQEVQDADSNMNKDALL